MVMRPQIDIVMTTYNAESYLDEQIASIVHQDYDHWILYVSDDGSQDGTPAVIHRWALQYPQKIVEISPVRPFHNVSQNVAHALGHTTAPYVMFADHDDVWLPNKITLTHHAMHQLERWSKKPIPLLVHTDLQVVDERLRLLKRSLWQYEHFKPLHSFTALLFQNIVTGCTMMANRTLIDQALPLPVGIVMYDWWFALVAVAFGHIVSLPSAPILYRQHTTNVIGAQRIEGVWIKRRSQRTFIRWTTIKNILAQRLQKTQTQAEAFRTVHEHALDPHLLNALNHYIHLNQLNGIQRRVVSWRFGYFGTSWRYRMAMAVFL